MANKEQILDDMLSKQRKDIQYNVKFELSDMNRILDNISTSPFDKTQCCIWEGAITHSNTDTIYINFYLKRHKKALHRLFYINYIADLSDNTYVRHTCQNKGICCNINHIILCNNKTTKQTPVHKKTITNISEVQVVKLDLKNPTDNAKLIVVLND